MQTPTIPLNQGAAQVVSKKHKGTAFAIASKIELDANITDVNAFSAGKVTDHFRSSNSRSQMTTKLLASPSAAGRDR